MDKPRLKPARLSDDEKLLAVQQIRRIAKLPSPWRRRIEERNRWAVVVYSDWDGQNPRDIAAVSPAGGLFYFHRDTARQACG